MISTWGLFFAWFKAVTQIESDFILADHVQSWCEMILFGAWKQVDACSASNIWSQKILGDTLSQQMPISRRYKVGRREEQFTE